MENRYGEPEMGYICSLAPSSSDVDSKDFDRGLGTDMVASETAHVVLLLLQSRLKQIKRKLII